jgi:DNA polymerase (family 10)
MDPNAAVAGVFEEIADYLELAGDNPFKIRAYRRAAEAIANLEGSVEAFSESGQLESVEGMGTATVAKTKEFLATGQVRLLQYLRSQYPPGLLDVLRVPGLGPKKVALLYKERGIDSLEKFIETLNSGGLAGLSGFGPKTIENLKTSIRRLAEMSARLPLPNALFQAGKLRGVLADGDTRVEIAGSLRRGADTIGNLNLVAGTNAASTVLDRFEKLPGVLAVLERGEDFARAKVHPGLEVEVVCTPPERFGSTLFFRTGSRPHVEAARAFGVDLENFAEEADLFAALGVPFIEPELRENLGEWEAAKAGKLPNLLKESDLRGDLHNHSTWSDGSATIRRSRAATSTSPFRTTPKRSPWPMVWMRSGCGSKPRKSPRCRRSSRKSNCCAAWSATLCGTAPWTWTMKS